MDYGVYNFPTAEICAFHSDLFSDSKAVKKKKYVQVFCEISEM